MQGFSPSDIFLAGLCSSQVPNRDNSTKKYTISDLRYDIQHGRLILAASGHEQVGDQLALLARLVPGRRKLQPPSSRSPSQTKHKKRFVQQLVSTSAASTIDTAKMEDGVEREAKRQSMRHQTKWTGHHNSQCQVRTALVFGSDHHQSETHVFDYVSCCTLQQNFYSCPNFMLIGRVLYCCCCIEYVTWFVCVLSSSSSFFHQPGVWSGG